MIITLFVYALSDFKIEMYFKKINLIHNKEMDFHL